MENPTTITAPAAAPRLYRSPTDKVVAGVCGGLAAYFGMDPVIVRLAFVVFALAGGASLLLYIIMWIVVPVAQTGITPAVTRPMSSDAIGALLIGGGVLWLLANLGVFRFINWSFAWPLVLVAIGLALLLRRN